MGKFQGVLLATDYDETLYGTQVGISRENRAAMEYFISQGGLFTVSTGRSLRNFSIQMEKESLPLNAPAILSNGANIYDYRAGRLLLEQLTDKAVIAHMAQVARVFPDLGFEAYCREEVYIHNPNSVTRRHLERAGLRGIETPILNMPAPWTKAILQQEDHGLLLNIQAYIQKTWPQAYEVIFSNEVLLELTRKGTDKGSAVLWLAGHLGVERSHLYCAGNGQNDLPMLKVAAEGFAPSNCCPELEGQGVTMLPSCGEHCIAALIDILDRRY